MQRRNGGVVGPGLLLPLLAVVQRTSHFPLDVQPRSGRTISVQSDHVLDSGCQWVVLSKGEAVACSGRLSGPQPSPPRHGPHLWDARDSAKSGTSVFCSQCLQHGTVTTWAVAQPP